MIDERRIEEAQEEIYEDRFLLNGEEIVFDNDDKEKMFYEGDIKEAIGLGAKWAINEFLNDLWHPMKEEPKLVGEEIIIEMFLKGKRHTIVLEYMVGEKEPIAVLESVRWITDWNSFIQPKENVIKYRWCYLKDLFPKEGGE